MFGIQAKGHRESTITTSTKSGTIIVRKSESDMVLAFCADRIIKLTNQQAEKFHATDPRVTTAWVTNFRLYVQFGDVAREI